MGNFIAIKHKHISTCKQSCINSCINLFFNAISFDFHAYNNNNAQSWEIIYYWSVWVLFCYNFYLILFAVSEKSSNLFQWFFTINILYTILENSSVRFELRSIFFPKCYSQVDDSRIHFISCKKKTGCVDSTSANTIAK